jgi:hypothetical protein
MWRGEKLRDLFRKKAMTNKYTLIENEKLAPGGKLEWTPGTGKLIRGKVLWARAMVPLPVPNPWEGMTNNPPQADLLYYEVNTKPGGKWGLFSAGYRSLIGYCNDWGMLDKAATIQDAKALAQAHFERRLSGKEVAPPPVDEGTIDAAVAYRRERGEWGGWVKVEGDQLRPEWRGDTKTKR